MDSRTEKVIKLTLNSTLVILLLRTMAQTFIATIFKFHSGYITTIIQTYLEY